MVADGRETDMVNPDKKCENNYSGQDKAIALNVNGTNAAPNIHIPYLIKYQGGGPFIFFIFLPPVFCQEAF
jgi:hypothetical protein